MAAGANATLLTNLIDPEVLADFIDKKLVASIKLSPLATVDNTLVGKPGDEITLPSFNYIGDAVDVAEGQDIPIAQLTTSSTKVKVAKIGKAVEISDEAILSGAGDVVNEAGKQILTAINSGVESALLRDVNNRATLTDTIAAAADASEGIADALTKFGEDLDGEKVIVVPPTFYARLRKTKSWIPNTEIGASAIIRGTVGMVHGCQVVTSDRVKSHDEYNKTTDTSVDASKTYYELVNGAFTAVVSPTAANLGKYYEKTTIADSAYIFKPGALRIYHKRNTLVEFDRDILAEMNYIKGSNIFAPYLYDASKAIKITLL
jgi:N4-gp56 family major capsid protein